MTVDLRAIVACDLGHLISGDVGSNHISDRSGLVMTSGRLTIEGLLSPARGTAVNLLVACPQLNRVTRFPKVLRVIRATAYPLDNRTEVEVGCMLTLMKERKDKATYFASGSNPLSAQALLTHCLASIGVTLTPGTRSLTRTYLLSQVDLSQGYVQIIGDLIRSENCVGRLRPDDTLEIIDISLSQGRPGPVLTKDDLVSIEPISGGQDPPDQFTVTYNAVERQPGDSSIPVLPDSYWTTSTTYSEPDYVYIRYTDFQGQDQAFAYSNAARTESQTRYKSIEYTDADGKKQKQEVATYKIDTKYSAVGAINSGFLSSTLRYNLRPVDFSASAASIGVTWYTYNVTKDGPVLSTETTEQRVSEMEFAGGMSIPDYVKIQENGFASAYYVPNYATSGIVTTRTIVKYETITVPIAGGLERTKTRTETSRWISRGLTQEGQQEFQWALKDRADNDIVPGLVQQYQSLRYEGTEVATSEGKPAVPSRPLPQEATAAAIGGQSTSSKTATGTVLYTAGQSPIDAITTTATYDMPYCPDDISTPGTAQAAALAFGQSEAALDVGHAFGYNIVTSFDRLPTLELSTVYIRLAGIEVAFLTDSLSYAFDASGMVVSSDLMLLGVSGYYGATAPATSWIRLASSPSALPQAPTPSTSVAMKANSISYPVGGVDPRNPGAVFALLGNTGTDTFGTYQGAPQLVGPTLELDAFALAAGPTVDVVEFNYALDTGTDVVDLATGPAVEFAWVTTIASPAATIAPAPFAPAISTGARVAVPAAALQVEAAAPAVASGASVAVPVASVQVAAIEPLIVTGRPSTSIIVPAASVAVAAVTPKISRSALVAVPVAGVAVASLAPSVQIVDPGFSIRRIEIGASDQPTGSTLVVTPINAAESSQSLQVNVANIALSV